jgi:cellulose synthase/poly-beta-1,6-N-acetylglucosamine synthase-like glycosyltransferase
VAVTPAIKIYNPDNILRKVQKVEYDWGIFLRKMLSFLDALYVTPGPFSFFRREIFEEIGAYKKAHNTEDMEMAMRLQTHGHKIKNCHTAFVYTIAPDKFSKLFVQRIRWTYGFLKNALDYKHLFFSKTQGNLGFLILPVMIISALSTLWMTGFFLFNIGSGIKTLFANWQAINFDFHPLSHFNFNLDWYYLSTNTLTFVTLLSFALMITFLLLGRKISEGKIQFKMDLLYFLIIYPFIAPTWLIKSIYNMLLSKKAVWR